jgi:hypothetical protein
MTLPSVPPKGLQRRVPRTNDRITSVRDPRGPPKSSPETAGHALGALAFAGRMLPDATLRGMRRFRSHGGIAPTVGRLEFIE